MSGAALDATGGRFDEDVVGLRGRDATAETVVWSDPAVRPDHTARPDGPGRASWVDVARGMAILLVVLHHATVTFGDHGGHLGWLGALDEDLATVRMPTFFLISGLFAARSLTAGWSTFTRQKIVHFAWLYTLWSAVYVVVAGSVAWTHGTSAGAAAAFEVHEGLIVDESLWYLAALPVFFLAARLLLPAPVWARVLVAAGLSVSATLHLFSTGSWGLDHMAQYFLWFLVGCLAGPRIVRRVGAASVTVTGLVAVVAVAVTVTAWYVLPAGTGWESLVTPVVVVPLLLLLARTAARSTVVCRAFGPLGRNTLPIYVLHPALLMIAGAVLVTWPPVVAIVARTLLVGAGSMAIWWMLRRLSWLWAAPARRPERTATVSRPRSGARHRLATRATTDLTVRVPTPT